MLFDTEIVPSQGQTSNIEPSTVYVPPTHTIVVNPPSSSGQPFEAQPVTIQSSGDYGYQIPIGNINHPPNPKGIPYPCNALTTWRQPNWSYMLAMGGIPIHTARVVRGPPYGGPPTRGPNGPRGYGNFPPFGPSGPSGPRGPGGFPPMDLEGLVVLRLVVLEALEAYLVVALEGLVVHLLVVLVVLVVPVILVSLVVLTLLILEINPLREYLSIVLHHSNLSFSPLMVLLVIICHINITSMCNPTGLTC